MARANGVKVEIFDVYPVTLGHCPHYNLLVSQMAAAGAEFCEISNQAVEYPDEVIRSHDRAMEIARFLKDELKGIPVSTTVEMVNLVSPSGLMKSLRHGLFGRFGIIINGKKVCDGEVDWARLGGEVRKACQLKSTG